MLVGGCGAERPRNIAIVAGLSSLGRPMPPAPKSPPSRQWTSPEFDERNFTQASCELVAADMSVVSGLTSELPSNGSSKSMPGEVNFESTAWITACCRAPRVTSLSAGSSWLTRTRE